MTAPAGTLQIDTSTSPPPTSGATGITQVGNNYFLESAGGTGPELKYRHAAVTTGEFSGWTPVAATKVASGGYDVAWKNTTTGQYTVWRTNSAGNYQSTLVSAVSGSSLTLESFETTFHQDLNGDGVVGLYAAPGQNLQISSALSGTSGSATIGTSATLELAAADSASVTFQSSTGMLKLDNPSTFSGTINNFSGNGTLSSSDQIDLKGINFSSVHDTYSNGVLTVTDGTHTDKLDFNGSYTLANFDFASDGSGGTIVYDPPASTGNSSSAVAQSPSNDAAVSALNQQFALWSQHMASAFPPGFGSGGISSTVGQSEWNSQLSQLAQPVAHQQRA